MKKLSKEILDVIDENTIGERNGPDDTNIWDENDLLKNFKVAEHAHWGGEDNGSDYGYVYKLTDKETNDEYFIKFQGYYQSYNGVEWGLDYGGSVSQVEPVDKVIVDWKEVK